MLSFPETSAVIEQLQQMQDACVAVSASVGMLFFTILQQSFRSPLHSRGMQSWLAIHGWNGCITKSPYGSIVNGAEWLILLSTTFFCMFCATSCFVFVPLAWCAARFCLQGRRPWKQAPFICYTFAVAAGAVLLFSDLFPVCVPLVIIMCAIVPRLEAMALSGLAQDVLSADLDPQNHDRQRADYSPGKGITWKLYPWYQLRPEVRDWRPSWHIALTAATLVTWLMFCIVWRGSRLVPEPLDGTHHLKENELLAGFGLFAAFLGGLIRVALSTGSVWVPRHGPITRLVSMRWIVRSSDRALLPLMFSVSLVLVMASLPAGMPVIKFPVTLFCLILIWLRSPPRDDDWQLTSEAKLTSVLLGK